ncbi:MAG: NAD-dependent epimerase/dehydratase family protein [Aggregatilineaceae bacterium]
MHGRNWNRVFITGGTGFIGLRVVLTLLEAGAEVTMLVQPDQEEKLDTLRPHVRLVTGDVWNLPSLRGRSRGHGVVVHLVGSLHAEPARGLTYHQINLVSARNAISMAVSDGVPHFILLSAASKPPGVSAEYLRSKREAEDYLRTSGLRWTIIRAPLVFDRGQPGGAFFSALSWIGGLPVLRLLIGRRAPLPVDIVARAIARAALQPDQVRNRRLYASDLRRLGRANRPGRPEALSPSLWAKEDGWAEEEVPFGWLPETPPKKQ